jgi:hypothetical protein
MKKNFMAFRVVVILSALLLGACSGKAQNNNTDSANFKLGGGKALASPTIITGQLESINGNEWVVDGQTFIVDSALLDPENPVQVGDSVSLEVEVNADGAFVVTSVENDDIGDDNDNTSGETEVENDNEQGNENDNEGIEDNDNEVENEDEFDDEGQNSDSSDDDGDGSSSDDD